MQLIIIQNFITGINSWQENSEKFQLNCEQQKKNKIAPNAYQTTHWDLLPNEKP